MPLGKLRERVLYGLGRGRDDHRYTRLRLGIAVLATLAIGLLPALDILRFDLWRGQHVLLGEIRPVDEVAKAFAFPFVVLNVLIVLATRLGGRYLCGFVCPIGSTSRLAEWFRWKRASSLRRFLGPLALIAWSALLTGITFAFWVDPRVFFEGSAMAQAIAIGFVVSGTLALYLLSVRLGLGFCRQWCPSGVYFAVLGPETCSGIEFPHPENCTDCHACENVCPVDLHPRSLPSGAEVDSRGLYPAGLPADAHCLRCGDCIQACEATTEGAEGTPLRMGWLDEVRRKHPEEERIQATPSPDAFPPPQESIRA